MKRFILSLSLVLFCCIAYAQNDTTLVKSPVKFETEIVTSKSGKTIVKYYAVINGKYYDSSKTAMKRYNDALRFGGTPNAALVENKKKTTAKIIVL